MGNFFYEILKKSELVGSWKTVHLRTLYATEFNIIHVEVMARLKSLNFLQRKTLYRGNTMPARGVGNLVQMTRAWQSGRGPRARLCCVMFLSFLVVSLFVSGTN
jgi:hypothetical protein